MKTTLLFICSLIVIPLFAQTEKGVSPITGNLQPASGNSDVVVGISNTALTLLQITIP